MTFTEQLLQELAEASGRIVKNGSGPDSANWPSRIAAARRSGRIPETKELYGGWCCGGYEIKLVDIPAWRLAVLEPRGQTVGFLVLQEQDRTEHVATEKELTEAKKYSWVRIPRFDYTPSERLCFVLCGDQPHRASEWADTLGRSLEEQLAAIAQEVALRGEAAERRRLDEIEAARQKRVRWEAAMEGARVRYAEAYRVRHLEAQEAAWRHATRLTEYVSAVRTRIEAMPPGKARTEAEAWISWAADTVERLDPLEAPPQLSSGTGAPTAPDTPPARRPAQRHSQLQREAFSNGYFTSP
ncbi:hypothetical protein ACWDG1_46940 [Streptomyces sp. NPDC001177]